MIAYEIIRACLLFTALVIGIALFVIALIIIAPIYLVWQIVKFTRGHVADVPPVS